MADQVPNNQVNPEQGNAGGRVPDNLDHLLPPSSVETPVYRALFDAVKELIHPTKLPPLEITSKPVDVPTMKGLYGGNEWKAGLVSALINGAIIGGLLLIGTSPKIQDVIKEKITMLAPVMPKKEIVAKPKADTSHGGGGSPNKLPDTKGMLPKVAPRTFVPPTVNHPEDPKLPMQVTIQGAPDINIQAANYGDPLAGAGIPSGGIGKGNGIGSGIGSGIGPGSGGGYGGGAFKIGGGVSAPVPTSKPEPEYSEEARKAKYQGEVLICLVVDEKGQPQSLRVCKKLGLGLLSSTLGS